jgi:hypothetical protein
MAKIKTLVLMPSFDSSFMPSSNVRDPDESLRRCIGTCGEVR